MTTPAAARKGRFGARVYPIPNQEGEIVDLTAVSNVLKVLAAPGLEIWKTNILVEQLARNPHLLMLAANPDTRRDAIRQAMDANRSASNIGTSLHYFSEAVDDGSLEWDLIPSAARPYIERYAEAKEKFGWRLIEKEVTCYCHAQGYAGTADRFMELPGEGVMVFDLKTGKSVYADTALQLSLYANAEGMWTAPDPVLVEAELKPLLDKLADEVASGVNPENGRKMSEAYQRRQRAVIDERRWEVFGRLGTKRPMPEGLRTDKGYVIHLSEDACELVPMNLTGTVEVIRGLCAVIGFQGRKDVVGKPLEASQPVVEPPVEDEEAVAEFAHAAADLMVPTGEAPVSTFPSPQDHFANLRARLIALPSDTKSKVAFDWPMGTPGLKVLAHSSMQLDIIDALLWEAECSLIPAAKQEAAAVAVVEMAFAGGIIDDLEEPF